MEIPFHRMQHENIPVQGVFGSKCFEKISTEVSVYCSTLQSQNAWFHRNRPILYIMEYLFPNIYPYQSSLKSMKITIQGIKIIIITE